MSQVQVLVSDEGNRRALAGMLEARHSVEVDETLCDVDCYIVDDHTIPEYRKTLLAHKREHHPVFCPVVLIRREDTDIDIGLPDADAVDDPQLVDEIMTAPVEKSVLFRRLSNLLVRRTQTETLIEKNERLEQFAYAASHDLQEPLRMVTSYLQLIERRYGDDLDEEAQEFIDFAVAGADRMRSMIESLLEYSRVTTRGGPLEPTNAEAVLEAVRDDLQPRIEATDATITAEELPTVAADAAQLAQVFQHLLLNALTFRGDASPRIHVSAERTGDMYRFTVADEGIGIDPAFHDRIFEVFEKVHAGEQAPEIGSGGIGLALCKRIIERHSGEIWVDSELGEGATFSFTMPAAGEQST